MLARPVSFALLLLAADITALHITAPMFASPSIHAAPAVRLNMLFSSGNNDASPDECLASLEPGHTDKAHITDCLAPVYGTPAEECDVAIDECQPSYVNQRLVGWAKATSKAKHFPSFSFMRSLLSFRVGGAARA